MARPKGHIRDLVPHADAVHFREFVGGNGASLATKTIPTRIDFQTGQDCTGSYAKLVENYLAARGITFDPVSRRFAYTLGRLLERKPLEDVGAIPALVIEGMRKFGLVPESFCPGDGPDVINLEIPFAEFELALQWSVTEIATIPETGMARVAAIRDLLNADFAVGYAQDVDAAYEALRGPDQVYSGMSGPSLGGHCQRIVGSAPGKLLVAGSWPDWGFVDPAVVTNAKDVNGGLVWVADAFIASDDVSDLYAVKAAPVVRASESA